LLSAPFGIYPQPAIGALSMSGPSILVAVNAVLLKNANIDGRASRKKSSPPKH